MNHMIGVTISSYKEGLAIQRLLDTWPSDHCDPILKETGHYEDLTNRPPPIVDGTRVPRGGAAELAMIQLSFISSIVLTMWYL